MDYCFLPRCNKNKTPAAQRLIYSFSLLANFKRHSTTLRILENTPRNNYYQLNSVNYRCEDCMVVLRLWTSSDDVDHGLLWPFTLWKSTIKLDSHITLARSFTFVIYLICHVSILKFSLSSCETIFLALPEWDCITKCQFCI